MRTKSQLMKNSIWIALAIISIFVVGIIVGTKMVPKPTIKETTTITKWEPWPYPVEVEVEVEKLVPVKTDPPAPEVIEKWKDVDSVAIVQAFLAKNHYDLDFSQDSLGKFVAHVDVQANEVVSASATIQPNIKIIERTETVVAPPKTQIYMMVGSSLDFQTAKFSGGVDIRDKWTVGASVIKQETWGYTVDFGIKF